MNDTKRPLRWRLRRKLPDRLLKYPVHAGKFPVLTGREFGSKPPKRLDKRGRLRWKNNLKSNKSLFISLLAGNLAAETGSTATASATILDALYL